MTDDGNRKSALATEADNHRQQQNYFVMRST
jgi:hypothetical protein